MSNDLAGVWEVALSDGVHRIEFEHGTTTGKRVIYVDGKVWNVTNRRAISPARLPASVQWVGANDFPPCRRSWDGTGCSNWSGRKFSAWGSRKPKRPSPSTQSVVSPMSMNWRSTGRAWRSTWRTGQRSPARGFSTWTVLTAGSFWVSVIHTTNGVCKCM